MTKLDELTERKLKALEKKLERIYSRANAELEEKANAFFSQFLPLQEKYDELLKSKQITQQEYDDALRKDILTASQYQELQSQLAYDYTKINEEALSIVNGELPAIYVLNYNETAKEIGSAVDGYAFQLVNEQTVRNLATQNKSYLPTKKIDIPKDLRWNQKRINAELLQGILQGESVDRIAKRLRNVTSMTLAESKRNARTMVTSAQNKARIDEYEKAEEDGVVLKKQWLAAIDSRTRETHRKLDGQERDIDEPFQVEDEDGILQQIRYPGDPLSAPALIYNCRCTLVTRVVGFRGKNGIIGEEEKPIKEEEKPASTIETEVEKYDTEEKIRARIEEISNEYFDVVMNGNETRKAELLAEYDSLKSKLEEIEKQKQIELRKHTFDTVQGKLGAENVEKMNDILANCGNENLQAAFFNGRNKLQVDDVNISRGAYYTRGRGINMNLKKVSSGDEFKYPFETSFHEFGHNLDYEYSKVLISDPFAIGSLSNNFKDANGNSLYDLIKSDFNDFRKLMTEEYRAAYGKATVSQLNSEVRNALKNEKLTIKQGACISDIIEGLTGNGLMFEDSSGRIISFGHGSRYWNSGISKSDRVSGEFFAEACESIAANPDSLEQMNRIFPNAMNLVNEMLGAIGNAK